MSGQSNSASAVSEQIANLKKAIAAQEGLRLMLGDAVVDAATAALRQQLDALSPDPSPAQGGDDPDSQTDDDQDTLSSAKSVVLCPTCGHVMRRGPLIRPNEHSPP